MIPIYELPPGELHVELARPLMRFGINLHIYHRSGQVIHHARVEDGDLMFTEIEPNAPVDHPTLYLTDELAAMLYKALSGEPIRVRGDAAVDHLKDAIQIRDRLLTMVEKLVISGS